MKMNGQYTTPEGMEFLHKKSFEFGVEKLESGVMYKVLKPGNGSDKRATKHTECLMHFVGTLIDGTEFENTHEKGVPMQLAPKQTLLGFREIMYLMDEGAIWEAYLPAENGYGLLKDFPKIPPGSVLIFNIEMIQITDHDSRYPKTDEL